MPPTLLDGVPNQKIERFLIWSHLAAPLQLVFEVVEILAALCLTARPAVSVHVKVMSPLASIPILRPSCVQRPVNAGPQVPQG